MHTISVTIQIIKETWSYCNSFKKKPPLIKHLPHFYVGQYIQLYSSSLNFSSRLGAFLSQCTCICVVGIFKCLRCYECRLGSSLKSHSLSCRANYFQYAMYWKQLVLQIKRGWLPTYSKTRLRTGGHYKFLNLVNILATPTLHSSK